MTQSDQLKELAVEYLSAMRLLLIKPQEFFATMPPLEDRKQKMLFALPPALVFSVGMAWQLGNALWALLFLPLAFGSIWLIAVALKYVLPVLGESRSLDELLHISSCAAPAPLLVGWIPVVGLPAMYVLATLFTFLGLVFNFKMNKGAATIAVTLPVVALGFGGGILSMLFIWLASISTIFVR